jgi:hypothetical protein
LKQKKIIYFLFSFVNIDLIIQAKSHILNAQQILEQINIQPEDDHLTHNLLGFEVNLFLMKCSTNTKQTLSQRDVKIKKKSIDYNLELIEEYLEKLKHLMSSKDYDKKYLEFLLIKLDIIINNFEEFNDKIFELVNEIIGIIEKYPSDNQITRQIDIYLCCGLYLIHFDDNIQDSFDYYKKAVELSEKEEEREASDNHKYQLANACFQWGKAKVRANRLKGKNKIFIYMLIFI